MSQFHNIFIAHLGSELYTTLNSANSALRALRKHGSNFDAPPVNIDFDVLETRLKKTVSEILEAMPPLPHWAAAYNLYELRVGAILFTRDGRFHGNATIIDLVKHPELGNIWHVATDVGNVMMMTDREVTGGFFPSTYIRSESTMDELLALVRSKQDQCCNQFTPKE